jgi:D-alanyl-D-alanine carboxypeptidase
MKSFIAALLFMAFTSTLTGQSVNDFIDSYSKEHNFNGTILIQDTAGISFQKSFGSANFQFKVPNTIETRYKIASITKLFTSVLVMQLFEQRLLDVNKHIKDYLPDYSGEGGDKVTIHQLLNHTSGMANIDTVKSIESALINGLPVYERGRSSDELLRKYCSSKLVNEPGKVFDYNNADYIVLGKIIENIYKKTFDQILAEKILLPLKMNNTGLIYQRNIIPALADSYFYRDDLNRLVPDLPVYMENWYAAGAMYSTSNDLAIFTTALFGHKILKQETLNKMFASGLDEYAYGVWAFENYEIGNNKYKIIKRPGRIMGAQGMIFHILETGSTIIILSNTGTTSLDDFAAEIAKQIIQ